MKVIDLLNKIANGEEVPRRIKVYSKWYDKGVIYFLTDTDFSWQDWYMLEEDNTDYGLFENNSISLNDEVKIIEDKKIEKIKDYSIMETMGLGGKLQERKITKDVTLEEIMNKINEIIDKLNGDE